MDFNLNRGPIPQLPPKAPMLLMVPGLGLIGLSILLWLQPTLLLYLVCGILATLGALLVFLARRMQNFVSR